MLKVGVTCHKGAKRDKIRLSETQKNRKTKILTTEFNMNRGIRILQSFKYILKGKEILKDTHARTHTHKEKHIHTYTHKHAQTHTNK